MQLTPDQQAMADGHLGQGPRWAISSQVKVGRAFGARRMVPVTSAHLMGDMEVLGDPGLAFLEDLAESGARVRIPTTTNARCVDFAAAAVLGQDADLVAKEARVKAALRAMGITLADTCVNYQTLYQPVFGEHLAWGDTGTVIYANSIAGARSNFESGPAALAAALTGVTPEYGFHLEEQRKPTVLVEVEATLDDLSDWGALGGAIGRRVNDYWAVPALAGTPTPGPDEAKHLGAALASYGSLAMFHLAGITREYRGAPARDRMRISDDDIRQVYQSFRTARQEADLVVLSGPQLSVFELRRVAELIDGHRVSPGTTLLITTNAQNRALAAELGYLATIQEAGGQVLTGTCFYLMTVPRLKQRHGWRTLVTNSAKVANIVGGYQLEPALRTTEGAVEAAITGKVTGV